MVKSINNKAWFFVIPALMLLGFVAATPLVIVFNYSFHDIFTLQSKIWVGAEWYKEVLRSIRFWESFGRSLLFSAIILILTISWTFYTALAIHESDNKYSKPQRCNLGVKPSQTPMGKPAITKF